MTYGQQWCCNGADEINQSIFKVRETGTPVVNFVVRILVNINRNRTNGGYLKSAVANQTTASLNMRILPGVFARNESTMFILGVKLKSEQQYENSPLFGIYPPKKSFPRFFSASHRLQ